VFAGEGKPLLIFGRGLEIFGRTNPSHSYIPCKLRQEEKPMKRKQDPAMVVASVNPMGRKRSRAHSRVLSRLMEHPRLMAHSRLTGHSIPMVHTRKYEREYEKEYHFRFEDLVGDSYHRSHSAFVHQENPEPLLQLSARELTGILMGMHRVRR
jgi:hypothetical protein